MFNHVAAVVATLKARKLAKEQEDLSAKAKQRNDAYKAAAAKREEKE